MNKTLLSLAFLLNAFNGSAEDTWKSNPNWLVLPSGKEKLGNMHGDVATSSNGDLYLSVGDAKAGLQVYGDDGTWKRNLPNAPSDLHGFVIRTEGEEEFIYGARANAGEVLKMTLEGKTVLKITASSIPDEFKRKGKNGKPLVRLTGADVAQNGDVFVTDGYSSDHIHRFDKNGKYLNSFGGKDAPYGFRTLHKLVLDHRFEPARILGMDRANNRVVHMSLSGDFIGVVREGLLLPACVHVHENWAVIGELRGRVTILDKKGEVFRQIGANAQKNEIGTNRTPPSKWRNGIVTAPHGITCNAKGDIFVAEWSTTGRVHRFDRILSPDVTTERKELFNGKNLDGWKIPSGNDQVGWYKAERGTLALRSGPKKKGSVLWTQRDYADFEVDFEFRFVDGVIDSGIHLRNSDQIQIGISGSLKRDMTCSPYIPGKGYPVEAKNVSQLLKEKDWNQMKIRAVGPNYTTWLQGQEVMNYKSGSAKKKGPIGIQLHGNRNMKIDFRKITVTEL